MILINFQSVITIVPSFLHLIQVLSFMFYIHGRNRIDRLMHQHRTWSQRDWLVELFVISFLSWHAYSYASCHLHPLKSIIRYHHAFLRWSWPKHPSYLEGSSIHHLHHRVSLNVFFVCLRFPFGGHLMVYRSPWQRSQQLRGTIGCTLSCPFDGNQVPLGLRSYRLLCLDWNPLAT